MKKYFLPILVLVFTAVSCHRDKAPSADTFSVHLESGSILEYERPVVEVTVGGVPGRSFYPGQVVVDGSPVTAVNAAATTLYSGRTHRIALPRLSPGSHEIELIAGKARSLYRDAEAACGERADAITLHLEVHASAKTVFVLAKPRTDQDDYVFIPEDRWMYDALTREVDGVAVRPGLYTVQVYPTRLQSRGFDITDIGSHLSIERKETAIGDGFEIKAVGTLKAGDPASQFTLSSGDRSITLEVD